jgi:hypothetical protein
LRSRLTFLNMLDTHQVAVGAEEAVRRLPVARDGHFESLYSYLVVDEPSVHLLPLHFLPIDSGHEIGPATLHDLGVAAKLEYTRNRWLDEMVDAIKPSPVPLSAHRLNDAIIALTYERYERVLDDSVAVAFYRILANLYARHGLSVILDGRRAGYPEYAISLKEYVEHARARHGPLRAPLDALLLLAGASERTIRRARVSWQDWALGVQFYDDALDVEEDFRDCNSSWVVARTLEMIRNKPGVRDPSGLPDPGEFHELALTKGVVCRALAYAEGFFAASDRQAGQLFPTWAAYQRECLHRTASLREDYEELVVEAEQRA